MRYALAMLLTLIAADAAAQIRDRGDTETLIYCSKIKTQAECSADAKCEWGKKFASENHAHCIPKGTSGPVPPH